MIKLDKVSFYSSYKADNTKVQNSKNKSTSASTDITNPYFWQEKGQSSYIYLIISALTVLPVASLLISGRYKNIKFGKNFLSTYFHEVDKWFERTI